MVSLSGYAIEHCAHECGLSDLIRPSSKFESLCPIVRQTYLCQMKLLELLIIW